jgi:RNA polymerase sigma-70 factor (ECF subfamily)
MYDSPASVTSATLLGRVGQDPVDPAAWDRFVERYGPRINAWCRRRQLQAADVDDVTQTVLIKLLAQMKAFRYDPSHGSFRAWLKWVTFNACTDFARARKRRPSAGGEHGSEGESLFDRMEDREDLAAHLNEEFDRELLELAKTRVQQRVEPRTWQAFCLMTDDGLSGQEVAERLQMNAAAVFVAKSNVQRMLGEEVQRLERADSR